MPGITSDLAQKIRRPPAEGLWGVSGGSPDDFRRDNIAGPHGISDPFISLVISFFEYLVHDNAYLR